MDDTIFLDRHVSFPPVEKASNPKYIKHVHCDGAYFHVLSWYTGENGNLTHCSEKRCILNKPAKGE